MTCFQSIEGWLEPRNQKLYVASKDKHRIQPSFTEHGIHYYEVLEGWEASVGFYWFALEKPDKDGVFFAFVQAISAEFGNVSTEQMQGLIKSGRVWAIRKESLWYSGVTAYPPYYKDDKNS